MIENPPELPERIKQAAIQVKITVGKVEYAWRYRDAVVAVIHIKRSGLLITSVRVVDESMPYKVIDSWTNRLRSIGYEVNEVDDAHHKAINFMTGCYDHHGDRYLYIVKCVKPGAA